MSFIVQLCVVRVGWSYLQLDEYKVCSSNDTVLSVAANGQVSQLYSRPGRVAIF
jgi:hypothetical protein